VLWDQVPLPYKLVAGSLTANDFTIDFVVPPSPVRSHLIAAGCPTGNGYALQQRVPVQVVAAALTLASSPQSVQAGRMVTMTGSGFVLCTDPAGSTTVELSANGTPLATASGSNGAFQQAITVPSGTPAGPYPVTAQCSAQPGNDLTSANEYVVTLTLSPSSGIPGTTISVTGAGYTQCQDVQLQLVRDTTQTVATNSPIVSADGSFTAQVTVPSSAALGTDYQVAAGCFLPAGTSATIAVEPFAVTSPATPSPTPSSTPTSSTSPSPAHSGTTTSPSSPGSPSPQSSRHTDGLWKEVALAGGAGAGLALVALLLVRAVSMLHGKRGRAWVSKHLRVVAGSAGPASARAERRPGAASVSVGLEPHLDHVGNQQYEEVAR